MNAALAALYAELAAEPPPPGEGRIGRPVPGEGPVPAALMLLGERPGDREDRLGRPFVGMAGRVLDQCLHQAGVEREEAYITSAIKRFRYVEKGKRRLHQSPNTNEIIHARWWLGRELAIIRPRAVAALGLTALRVLTGERRLGPLRGQVLKADPALGGAWVVPTIHPAYVLHLRATEAREREAAALAADLARAARLAHDG